MSGVSKPREAFTGLRPKVLNSKLNQTTSGFSVRSIFRIRKTVRGSSKDQQRITEKPSNSGSSVDTWSARIVTLRNGFLCSSWAMCRPYSLNPP
jgi:hypothetical protein